LKLVRQPRQFEQQAKAAQAVRKRVWDPVEPLLDGCDTVIVIPDQQLCGIPWGALPGKQSGTFLIESLAIATAQYGQQVYDLLSREPPTGKDMLLVGDLDYGVPLKTADYRGDQTKDPWMPLAQTREELEEIKKLYPTATLLNGRQATETALRERISQFRYIHLATHGFFGHPDAPVQTPFDGFAARNPLVRSGLVVSGANAADRSQPSLAAARDDGLLLAEELAELDLSGTELVVLSACSTHLGDVVAGEGVMGLQRTINHAGARTVVASLWDVDDPATRALMVSFYQSMSASTPRLGKLAALRQAQLEMIRSYQPTAGEVRAKGREARYAVTKLPAGQQLPPYYWAAFTLSGDWR
jgi:CHAT domain-containing protein